MAVKVGFNRKRVSLKTPAGNKATAATSSGTFSAIEKVGTYFSFGVDAANAVPATSLRGDPFSVARTDVGKYLVKLGGASDLAGGYGVRKIIAVFARLQKSAAGVLDVDVLDVTDSTGEITLQVVNRNTGAASNPAAAGTHERIHVEVIFDNGPN
jgi:hypothetical protein